METQNDNWQCSRQYRWTEFAKLTEALHAAGCGRVYAEKQSGIYTDRPQLAKAIGALGEGDTLVVCKLDRLARSVRDLLSTLDAIGKAGASFRSLSDQWADTTTPHGRLMLTVLGGLAEFERHLILTRTVQKDLTITFPAPCNNVGPNLGRHLRGMGDTEIGAGLSRTRTGPDFTAGHLVHANARRRSPTSRHN